MTNETDRTKSRRFLDIRPAGFHFRTPRVSPPPSRLAIRLLGTQDGLIRLAPNVEGPMVSPVRSNRPGCREAWIERGDLC